MTTPATANPTGACAPATLPALCDLVHYRGKQGLCTPRAAIVVATVDSLDPRGVESGAVPALDSAEHVHLWVFGPGSAGFAEFNTPRGEAPDGEAPTASTIPPGTWCRPPSHHLKEPPMQKPSAGRIVLFAVDPRMNGGVDHAPAVITQVWNDNLINLQVFPNANDTRSQLRTSVPLHETREDAEAVQSTGLPYAAWWPPRV
ncbi:hypothetical protein [Dactylosporangium sp. CS-033363]|uniref:hypothetical protein n=1 Tax=Dactylosporangium sp. CS-033363 TaxID=3239935 RepID=UPI003D942DA5